MSNERHILDLILTPDEHDINYIKNQSLLGQSDHSVLEFKLNCMSIEEVFTSEKYNYNEGDYIGLKESLNKDWDEVFKDCKNEPDIQWGKYMET